MINMYGMPVAANNMLTEFSLCVQVSLHIYWPYEGKQEGAA